jgi:hypothetical protein
MFRLLGDGSLKPVLREVNRRLTAARCRQIPAGLRWAAAVTQLALTGEIPLRCSRGLVQPGVRPRAKGTARPRPSHRRKSTRPDCKRELAELQVDPL